MPWTWLCAFNTIQKTFGSYLCNHSLHTAVLSGQPPLTVIESGSGVLPLLDAEQALAQFDVLLPDGASCYWDFYTLGVDWNYYWRGQNTSAAECAAVIGWSPPHGLHTKTDGWEGAAAMGRGRSVDACFVLCCK